MFALKDIRNGRIIEAEFSSPETNLVNASNRYKTFIISFIKIKSS